MIVLESPDIVPQVFYGAYLKTDIKIEARFVYKHANGLFLSYNTSSAGTGRWVVDPRDGSTPLASIRSTAQFPQGIGGAPLTGWERGLNSSVFITLTSACQSWQSTSTPCKYVRVAGRNPTSTISSVNGVWAIESYLSSSYPVYKHVSSSLFMYWSNNGWTIGNTTPPSLVVLAIRPSNADNTYVPLELGSAFASPWLIANSSGGFSRDPNITSWCLGCGSVSFLWNGNNQSYYPSGYMGPYETYRPLSGSLVLLRANGGWAYASNYTMFSDPVIASQRSALSTPNNSLAWDPNGSSTCSADPCQVLSCSQCFQNAACSFCPSSSLGPNSCVPKAISCTALASSSLCPVTVAPSCPALLSPNNSLPAMCFNTTQACIFSCRTGYIAVGSTNRSCSGSTWSGTPLVCSPKPCAALPPSPSYSITCSGVSEGAACSFSCANGSSSGSSYRVCSNGVWSGATFVCSPFACPALASPANAIVSSVSSGSYMQVVTFNCLPGYGPSNASVVCTNGVWEGTHLQCSPRVCPTLLSPPGAVQATCQGLVHGQTCSFTCSGSGVPLGDPVSTCMDGKWVTSAGPFSCTNQGSCPTLFPPVGSNSSACFDIKNQGQCSMVCDAVRMSAGDPTRICTSQGGALVWQGSPLSCPPKQCPILTSPLLATPRSCIGMEEGDVCSFECIPGYMAGNSMASRKCSNGQWQGSNFICVKKACPTYTANAFSSPPFATCAGLTYLAECSIVCASGYGPATYSITCLDGVWAKSNTSCVPLTCPVLTPVVNGNGTICTNKLEGETCTLGCVAPAVANNPLWQTRVCVNGAWNGKPLACTLASRCEALYPPFGSMSSPCSNKGLGETCSLTCSDSYVISSGDHTRRCTNNGWSGSPLVCSALVCPPLQSPRGAVNRTCPASLPGALCVFECDSDFAADSATSLSRTCEGGVWTSIPLVCLPLKCPLLTAPPNSLQFGTTCDGGPGAVCEFNCVAGFIEVGEAATTCRSGRWSKGNVLQCVDPASLFVYTANSWSPCTTSCGPGTRTRRVECRNITSGSSVDASVCQSLNLHPVASVEDCNNNECIASFWKVGDWGECSQSCALASSPGQQQRQVTCQSAIGVNMGLLVVMDSLCDTSTKPASTQVCGLTACIANFTWTASLWGACSASCGGGVQTRTLTCKDSASNVVLDGFCTSKPAAERPCNTQACSFFSYIICSAETCTAPCNGVGAGIGMMGYMYQRVFCAENTTGYRVHPSLCSGSVPTTEVMQGCNPQACTTNYWMTSMWSDCNVSDLSSGAGTRTRKTHCHFKDGKNADATDCDASLEPSVLESCNINVCPGAAYTGLDLEPVETATSFTVILIAAISSFALLGIIVICKYWRYKRNWMFRFKKENLKNDMKEMADIHEISPRKNTSTVPKFVANEARKSVGLIGRLSGNAGATRLPDNFTSMNWDATAPSTCFAPGPIQAPLPEGWQIMNCDEGVYYENTRTGVTQWQHPSLN